MSTSLPPEAPEVRFSVKNWDANSQEFFAQACTLLQASAVEAHGEGAKIDAPTGLKLWQSGHLLVFAATMDGVLAGICLWTRPTASITSGRVESTLVGIYVVQEQRRSKLAAQLLAFAEQIVMGRGAKDLLAGARPDDGPGGRALEFWDACGYEPYAVTMRKTVVSH